MGEAEQMSQGLGQNHDLGGEVKRLVLTLVTLVVVAGVAAPAQAIQGAAKKYSSCSQLLEKYPNGVAKTAKARNSAVKAGFAEPNVSRSLYKKNGSRLDKDNNGVMCEQEGSQTLSFKTDFGFITTQSVDAPKAGQCVNIPISMDVRNLAPVGSFGMTVRLISEFATVMGYEEISTDEAIVYPYTITSPGVYDVSLKVCGDPHKWTHASGNRTEDVQPVRTDERLALVFYRWLGDVQLGSEEYFFN